MSRCVLVTVVLHGYCEGDLRAANLYIPSTTGDELKKAPQVDVEDGCVNGVKLVVRESATRDPNWKWLCDISPDLGALFRDMGLREDGTEYSYPSYTVDLSGPIETIVLDVPSYL